MKYIALVVLLSSLGIGACGSGKESAPASGSAAPVPPEPSPNGTSTGDVPPAPPLQPERVWTLAQARAVLDRTQRVHMAPDLSMLTDGERLAVRHLLAAGAILQRLYERSLHRDAEARHRALVAAEGTLDSERVDALKTLYRLFHGPVATTLENQREPFLDVDETPAGVNVYPWAVTREQVQAYLTAHPQAEPDILALRSVVRRANRATLDADLATLRQHPALSALHHGLQQRLQAVTPAADAFYAIPYSVAYADDVARASRLIFDAAAAVHSDDPEFAGYLRNRARDLLTNDYESGDAAWVTGRFKNLNAQIGAYEVYDDALYGRKAFWCMSVLVRDIAASEKLAKAIGDLQGLEDGLPYTPHKPVRSDIPVGVYSVIADFGQARQANTASILPNDSLYARRYGRTILLRANVMRHPQLFANVHAGWTAVVAPAHRDELTVDGNFERTLWHEVGHYLGPDRDHRGRPADVALQEFGSVFEEMKADLVSLYVARTLHSRGYHSDAALRAIYASGVYRSMVNAEPRATQPYAIMRLMQFNFFVAEKLVTMTDDGLVIDYARYHEVVEKLLKEIFRVQQSGERAQAEAFVKQWTEWQPALHDALADRRTGAQKYQFSLMAYDALGDAP